VRKALDGQFVLITHHQILAQVSGRERDRELHDMLAAIRDLASAKRQVRKPAGDSVILSLSSPLCGVFPHWGRTTYLGIPSILRPELPAPF